MPESLETMNIEWNSFDYKLMAFTRHLETAVAAKQKKNALASKAALKKLFKSKWCEWTMECFATIYWNRLRNMNHTSNYIWNCIEVSHCTNKMRESEERKEQKQNDTSNVAAAAAIKPYCHNNNQE